MNNLFAPEPCPLCKGGIWKPYTDGTYQFRHGRKSHSVSGQHYAMCGKCGTRGYLPGQRDANQQSIREYQNTLLGYVSPADVLALREKYLLTQEQAGVIFGGGKHGFSKWECGKATPAGPTARLIKLALKLPDVMRALAADAGVQLIETPNHNRRVTDNNKRYSFEPSTELANAKPIAGVVIWTPNPQDLAALGLGKPIVKAGSSVAPQRRIAIFARKQVGVPRTRYVDVLRDQAGGNTLVAGTNSIRTATLGEDFIPDDCAVNPLTGALFPTSINSAASKEMYGN